MSKSNLVLFYLAALVLCYDALQPWHMGPDQSEIDGSGENITVFLKVYDGFPNGTACVRRLVVGWNLNPLLELFVDICMNWMII